MSAVAEQPSGLASPGTIVARVGPYRITGATFDRSIAAALSREPNSGRLVPPQFSACVAEHEAELAPTGEGGSQTSQFRSECRTRYQVLLQGILERLIADDWLIGGARELGVPVSDEQVKASFARYRRKHFSSAPRFHRYLAGRTVADLMLETRAILAAGAIKRAINDRVPAITHEQIESYYQRHRFEYLIAASRDVKIVRTESEGSALKVRSEISAGESFANVVKHLNVKQSLESKEGLVLGLQPHVFGEPHLNEAIFTTAPHVLRGPIKTWFGYFVFEVMKVKEERVQPLRGVEAAIRGHLLSPLQERAFTLFNSRWNATWTKQTDCAPGDIVPKCRQFKGVAVGPPENSAIID